MKNEPSPLKVSLLKITILGCVGTVFLFCLHMLTTSITDLLNFARSTGLAIGLPIIVILLLATVAFIWYSLNIITAIILAMTIKTATLAKIISKVGHPLFRLDRWALQPFTRILRWTIVERQKTS